MAEPMPSRAVETITNNEDDVRMQIYDGTLPISKAAAKLLHLERSQRDAERRRYRELVDTLASDLDAAEVKIEKLERERAEMRGGG